MAPVSDLKFCLKWETERPFVGRPRQSSDFRMLGEGEEWYLKLSLEDSGPNYPNYICGVYMYRRKGALTLKSYISATAHVVASCLALHGQHDPIIFRKSGDQIFYCYPDKKNLTPSNTSSSWTIYCRLSSVELLSLQVDNETLHLSLDNKNSPITTADECVQVSSEIPRDIESLSADISGLLDEEILPDFKLNCGGRSFPVHRSILAARSEVFRSMFRSGMLESETGSADIKDLEVPVLESLLKFLYSGKLEDLTEDTAGSLYAAADKYAVHSLRKACSYWLERNLNEENCINYLSMADSHCDPDLTAATVQFIVQHPGLFKSAAWLTLSEQHPVLANKVFQAYFS